MRIAAAVFILLIAGPVFAQESVSGESGLAYAEPVPAYGEQAVSAYDYLAPYPVDTWEWDEGLVPIQPEIPGLEQLQRLGMIWMDDWPPIGAQTSGAWNWNPEVVTSGFRSHGHPPKPGLASHGFTAEPKEFLSEWMVVQDVWLDPKDPPQGIALKFALAGGKTVGVYWEGEKEVFSPQYHSALWYYGILPEFGVWSKLEVLVEDLGIEGQEVAGVSFVTYDGRVLWDKTLLKEASPDTGKKVAGPTPSRPSFQ